MDRKCAGVEGRIRGDCPLFLDPTRKAGIYCTGVGNERVIAGRLDYAPQTASPHWLLTQQGCRYDLLEGRRTSPSPCVFAYEDAAKRVEIDTLGGTFRLALDGTKIFETPRTVDQPIAGLALLPYGLSEKVPIGSLSHLYVTLDFTLERVEDRTAETVRDRGLHTVQWNYYLYLEDGRGGRVYIGLPLYDSRHRMSCYIAADPVMDGIFLYIPPVEHAFGETFVEVGKRFCRTVDMLPLIRDGFEIGNERGFFDGHPLCAFYPVHATLGWEVTTSALCEATVYEYTMSYSRR